MWIGSRPGACARRIVRVGTSARQFSIKRPSGYLPECAIMEKSDFDALQEKMKTAATTLPKMANSPEDITLSGLVASPWKCSHGPIRAPARHRGGPIRIRDEGSESVSGPAGASRGGCLEFDGLGQRGNITILTFQPPEIPLQQCGCGQRGMSSLVHTEEVTGSIPVSPTKQRPLVRAPNRDQDQGL